VRTPARHCAGPGAADAVPVLEDALDFYLRIGAQRRISSGGGGAAGLGHPAPEDRARAQAVEGWESLTDSELGVIRLAAEGLTNRQIGDCLFISRRTVGTHLAHVFQKLDVSNRSQLAAEVTRREGQR
jgi:DNA-binding CsgD family transcriptional regulator